MKPIFFKGKVKGEFFTRNHAFPEGVLEGEWLVEDSHGKAHVGIHDKTFFVPVGNNPRDIAIRNHEMSHIKWSPVNKGTVRDKLDEEAIAAFEDVRVNMLALKHDVDISNVFTNEDVESGKYHVPENNMMRLLMVLVTLDYKAYELWKEKSNISPVENVLIDKTYIEIKNNIHNYESVKKLACDFTELFREKPKEEEKKPEEKKEEPKPKFKIVVDLPARKSDDKKKDDLPKIRTAETLSGKMTVIENLEMTSKSVLMTEKRTDCGYILKHPERIITDKMCFVTRRKTNNIGTIVIDCSGSMSINLNQLKRIVQKSNGATIAGYSGTGDHGNLYVLSRNGRIVKNLPRFNGGNIIDYPALLWLLENKRPSIWISDGVVTGIGDITYDEVGTECFKIVEKNGIINIHDLNKLEELMDGK